LAPAKPRSSGAGRPAASDGAAKGSARGAERRRQAQRRNRLLLAGSIVTSALMLVAWFPFTSLLNQHRQLSQASAELSSLKAQDQALAHEQSALTSTADVTRLAREQYQLLEPGQRLVQVLPPSGTPSQSGTGQAPFPGDPGLTKPVAPSAVALLPSAITTTTTQPAGSSSSASSHAKASGSAKPGLVQRILSTLSFWRR
jgi:cell division protein FtsB